MEIKFRVPIFKDGKFDKFNYHTLKVGAKSYSFGNCHFMGDYEVKEPELFTGAYDHKGNEVYEGDLFFNHSKKVYGVVGMHQGSWVVSFPSYTYPLYAFLENDPNRGIAGNIHENAELLNKVS